MRIIVGAGWLVLFVVLFAFAVNNTAMTDLHFFAGMSAKAPLIALLLAFFIAGFACGTVALLPGWVRQRVEIRRLRRVGAAVPLGAVREPASVPATADVAQSADTIQSVARGARTTN